MVIRRGRVVVGVRYDMVFEGKTIDSISTGGKGGIRDLIAAADRNPGMDIIATVYELPFSAYGRRVETILSRQKVYPLD